jgi:very-short-patch-repair endonuclease
MMGYPIFSRCIERLTGITPMEEYRFHPSRRWRFDLALPSQKIAIEIEGGAWVNGRHVRPKGYRGDMEKYNQAQLLGWRVLRYAPDQIAECITDLGALVVREEG